MEKLIDKIIIKPIIRYEGGVMYVNAPAQEFEKLYLEVRKAEGWFYEGEKLLNLPLASPEDPQKKPWAVRKKSAEDLIKYLVKAEHVNSLLDIGCGNGWLTNKIAEAKPGTQIIGVDVIAAELQLAAKTFQKENISWVCGNVMENIFRQQSFDIILLSASVQYFPDFQKLINQLFQYLQQDGEIHIIDTPFYTPENAGKAKQRTEAYYTSIGFPGMKNNYHHRLYAELIVFQFQFFYKPQFLQRIIYVLLKWIYNPFPWVVIRK